MTKKPKSFKTAKFQKFSKVCIFLTVSFFIWKENWIFIALKKKSSKSEQQFWRYHTSKKKIIKNWASKAYFRPSCTQMGLNFRFYVLFFCDKKKKWIWYITRGIYPVFLENLIFLPNFALLPVFTKSDTVRKRVVIEKVNAIFGFRVKKSWISVRGAISREPLVRSLWVFCKLL